MNGRWPKVMAISAVALAFLEYALLALAPIALVAPRRWVRPTAKAR